MIKLAGVVVLYQPDDGIKENIESYLSSLKKLYVIDNSPNSDNKKKLPNSKKLVYISYGENKGVAYALNDAAKRAIADDFEWLLTMDQDSKFVNTKIKKMLEYLEKNNTDKLGLICPWHIINTGVKKPKEKIDHPLEVMTSGNIINLSAFKVVGGFKEWLFIDCIDIEYCMNLHVHNYDIARLNEIELLHHLGDICVKHHFHRDFVCSNHNYIRRYYMVRNTFYVCSLYKEYFPDYCSFLKRGLRGQLMNIILFEKDKYRKVRNMYRGYRDFKKGKKGPYPYEN